MNPKTGRCHKILVHRIKPKTMCVVGRLKPAGQHRVFCSSHKQKKTIFWIDVAVMTFSKEVGALKRNVILGVFLTVVMLLSACGGSDSYEEMTLDELKEFVSDKQTGFILFTYDRDDIEENRKQVTEALEENNQEAEYFNYSEQVSNEQSTTFQKDVGTEQSRDSLGYYEDGVLMAEFESPNDWSEGKIEDLNKFISQISN